MPLAHSTWQIGNLARLTPHFIYGSIGKQYYMNEEVTSEDLKAINHFSKISFSSQMYIGNFKKGNCEHFDGEVCNVWSWGGHEFSGLNRRFVLGEPKPRKGRLVINPHPFFCSLCPKWVISKETLRKGSKI